MIEDEPCRDMNLCAVLAGCCILAAIALGTFFITRGLVAHFYGW